MPRQLPPLSAIIKTLHYDPGTGRILSRISRTSRRAGTHADASFAGRYRMVYIGGALHYAHRVVWKMHYGKDPSGFIDHIDGDPLNNRVENLRIATHPMNMCNRPAPPHNTSGEKGVSYRKDNGKWRASITVERRRINLGQFDSVIAARAVIRKMRRKLHGIYARD